MFAASSSSTVSTDSTSVRLNLPPSLVFLVANIHSLVPIKLDSNNYVIWRTQIEHALKANGFFGYVDGSIVQPASDVVRTTEVTVSAPDLVLWKIIDGQLVSCLIATISATTLPLVLGIDHAVQVWQILEHRFNSVSKTHIHDLKQQLFNVTKTTTLDAYFDTIKELSYKLAAAGAPLSNDDIIFHALHGLPSDFDTLQTALSARIGDLSFEELITIVNGEEIRKNRSSGKPNSGVSSSVFLTVNKTDTAAPGTSSYSPSVTHQGQTNPGYATQLQSTPQYYNSQPQPPMYPATYPQPQNRNGNNNNRSRGFRNQREEVCQICNKTNHTAKTCYYRSDLNYQPPSYYSSYNNASTQRPPIPQAHMLQTYPYPALYPSTTNPGLLPLPPSCPNYSVPYPSTYSTSSYPVYTPSPSSTFPPTVPPPSNWYLDSGATNHVTNDFSQLSLQHSQPAPTGVMVGNGHTIPVAHSGQQNQSDSSSWTIPSGVVSNSGLI